MDNRRRFLSTVATSMAAAQLGILSSADAQSSNPRPADVPPIKPGTDTSLGLLKQIDAGVLSVGYAEAGPGGGPVAILLHGWPYDIHSYVDVAPVLASRGYRVIVPFLRGYGTTRSARPGPNASDDAVFRIERPRWSVGREVISPERSIRGSGKTTWTCRHSTRGEGGHGEEGEGDGERGTGRLAVYRAHDVPP